MLESLLERATADDPSVRPSMREVADELSWWGDSVVATRVDLSSYAEEVNRLRAANDRISQESHQQRLVQQYNEAARRVFEGLFVPLKDAIEFAGLRRLGPLGPGVRELEGWPPHPDYGGTSHLPRWGIETLASPWLGVWAWCTAPTPRRIS